MLAGAAERIALAFKLRASPSADLNLYPKMPAAVQSNIEARSMSHMLLTSYQDTLVVTLGTDA